MSFDLKLRRICDHRIYNEEHLIVADNRTVYTKYPISNRNIVVKVNNYEIPQNNFIEKLTVEDFSEYFDGIKNTLVVSGSIYDGLNLQQFATNKNLIQVQMKVEDENNSFQFSGVEDWFFTQHAPLLTEINFSGNLLPSDVEVKINGVVVVVSEVDSKTGRISLKSKPLVTDLVTVSYFYKAKIKSFNSSSGLITLDEYPALNQQVKVRYFSKQKNGWQFFNDNTIVFDQDRKTNRIYVEDENVSSQFDGVNTVIKTKNFPLMPLNSTLTTRPSETLQNSVDVSINGFYFNAVYVDANYGFIYLDIPPSPTDVVLVSYYYKDYFITPDIITTEYQTNPATCPKCFGREYVDDFEFDNTGGLITVVNEDKLAQDALKIVSTIKGSNTEHVWYGSNLESLIGYSMIPSVLKTRISVEIQNAMRDLKELQVKQSEYQQMTNNEFLDTINNLIVLQDKTDPSYWTVQLNLITQARTIAKITESIQVES